MIYLWILFPDKLKDKDKNIIKTFSLILEATIKTDWLEKFLIGNTKMIIRRNVIGIGVNIPDIKYVIQWKIVDYSIFTTIFQ